MMELELDCQLLFMHIWISLFSWSIFFGFRLVAFVVEKVCSLFHRRGAFVLDMCSVLDICFKFSLTNFTK